MRIRLLCAAVAALWGVACTPQAPSDRCDPQALRAARGAQANHTELTVCGSVAHVVRVRRTRSGRHRIFVLLTTANERLVIDANVDVMGDIPIRTGERAVVHGEYYFDGPGRDGVHWTHRTDRGSHPPGYIILDGTLYR